jgi:transposase
LTLNGYPILLIVEPRNVLEVNRVPHHRGAEEWLEPDDGRPSCPVLRGRRRSNALLLPDQVHGVNERGKAALTKVLRRAQVMPFFAQLPPCLIGMEACGSAHFWARKLIALGHTVKLMAPQFVKPYVKTNKNDARDAEAICEAVGRPSMRFVAIKTPERQALLALHRARQGLVRARTAQGNQIRGLLSEFGLVIPKGRHHLEQRIPDILPGGKHRRCEKLQERPATRRLAGVSAAAAFKRR